MFSGLLLGISNEQKSALEFASGIADMTGHDKIAVELTLIRDHLDHNDAMRTIENVINLLLSPEMSYEQYTDLCNVSEKVDAILKLGEVFPETIRDIKNGFAKITDGHVTIDYLNSLVHAAIEGYEREHQ